MYVYAYVCEALVNIGLKVKSLYEFYACGRTNYIQYMQAAYVQLMDKAILRGKEPGEGMCVCVCMYVCMICMYICMICMYDMYV